MRLIGKFIGIVFLTILIGTPILKIVGIPLKLSLIITLAGGVLVSLFNIIEDLKSDE